MKAHFQRIVAVWLFFAVVVAAFALSGIKMAHISRDPQQLADFPLYYGLLSNMGILVWAAGAFVPLFAATLLKRGFERSLFFWIGVLTFLLLADDFFLLHDAVFPNVFHLPEILVYLVYAAAFVLFFLKYWKFLVHNTPIRLLYLAFFLLGVAVLIDMDFLPGGIDVEDSFKLYGMVVYSYYWIVSARGMILRSFTSASPPCSEPS
ncbi:MAG: hypothetical protein ACLFQR_07690 [Desulfovibrionales bacterium]